jgi:UDP-sugar diphosphatase
MIEQFKLQPLTDPQYIRPYLATYIQDGTPKDWEVMETHDSVAILIYHKKHNSFVLVKQFRPAVYLNNNDGVTVELCAGLVDKDIPLVQVAKEEILEECGYDVPIENITKITSFHTSVGFAGSKQTLYYAQVDESARVGEGGGIDDEQIEVIELPVEQTDDFIFDESIAKTPGLMFAFYWWRDKHGGLGD